MKNTILSLLSFLFVVCTPSIFAQEAAKDAQQAAKIKENLKAAQELKQLFHDKFQGNRLFKTLDYYLNNVSAHTLLSPVFLKALNELKKEVKIKLRYSSIEPVATFERAMIKIIDPMLIISHLESGKQIKIQYNEITISRESTDSDCYFIDDGCEMRIYTGPIFPAADTQNQEVEEKPLLVVTKERAQSRYKFSEQGYIEDVKSKTNKISIKTNEKIELCTIDAVKTAVNVLHRGDHMSSSVNLVLSKLQPSSLARAFLGNVEPLTIVYHADYDGNYIEHIDLPSLEKLKKEELDRFNGNCKLHEFSISTAGSKLFFQGLTQFHKDPPLPFVTVELLCKCENYQVFIDYAQAILPLFSKEEVEKGVQFLKAISIAPASAEEKDIIITLRRGDDGKIMVGKNFEHDLTQVYKEYFKSDLTLLQ